MREPGIRIRTLPDVDALQALQPQWRALWQGLPDATPFQSPAWLLCWARNYAPRRSGAIVAFGGDRLLALLPFFTWEGAVWLAGTGPSDYGDALIAPEARHVLDQVLEALAEAALQRRCERIDLRQLRPGSALLKANTPAGWRDACADDETCLSVRLRSADGMQAVSPRWRSNIAAARRRLAKAGTCELRPVPAAQVEDGVRVLLRLHAQRWRARGEPGLFGDDLFRRFVCAVIPALHAAGLLRLHLLTCDGRRLAETFAIRAPCGTCLYSTGFDPEWSRYSPGLLAMAGMVGAAARESDRFVHFLRGRESYKYHLGATESGTRRRVLRRATARG